MSEPAREDTLPRASLARRLAAMLYDGLLVVALLFVATALLLPLNRGEAITPDSILYLPLLAVLIAVIGAFFVGFWTHGNQTLGMRAWRLRLRTLDGAPVSYGRAGLRLLGASLSLLPAGLGYWWMLIDRGHTWHDRLSGTEIVLEPRDSAQRRAAQQQQSGDQEHR